MSAFLPTVEEELDRKAIETLEYLVGKHRSGAITDSQYRVALDTLFMTVSGIIGADFINLITAAGDEIKQPTIVAKVVEKEEVMEVSESKYVGGSW